MRRERFEQVSLQRPDWLTYGRVYAQKPYDAIIHVCSDECLLQRVGARGLNRNWEDLKGSVFFQGNRTENLQVVFDFFFLNRATKRSVAKSVITHKPYPLKYSSSQFYKWLI